MALDRRANAFIVAVASEALAKRIRETFLTDKIEWSEPKEITELKLREETLPGLQKMFRQCTRYFLMASIPLVALGYFVNGFGFSVLVLSVLTLMIYQVPFLIWMNIRQARKAGVRYRVNLKGIQINQGFFLWRQIEGYNFSEATIVPEAASLNIKLLQRKKWQSLSFYRQEVNEQELRAMLERFIPQADQPTV